MVKQMEVEEIKKLIKSGFNLDLISFELDIPIEELIKYSKQLESELNTSKEKGNDNKSSLNKMEVLRKRYKKLLLDYDDDSNKEKTRLTEKTRNKINISISNVEKISNEIKDNSKENKRKHVTEILSEINKIKNYPLTIEQSERLNDIFKSVKLINSATSSTDRIDYEVKQTRRLVSRKVAEAIDNEQANTVDLEELNYLEKKITTQLEKQNPILISAIKSKIRNKVFKIKQKNITDKIKSDIPLNIHLIILELANGTLDIKKANKIIEEQAKINIQKKSKTKFSLSEEQEKRQIIIQIRKALSEKANIYNITNIENTIIQLEELCCINRTESVLIVIENLIDRKDFKTAKDVCKKLYTHVDNEKSLKDSKILKAKIKNAEISDMVLKGLNMNGTDEEETKYYELLEKGIKQNNVNLQSIILGKNKNGLRSISLADIWEEKKVNKSKNENKTIVQI